jgi:hypothetical protein
MEMQGEKDFLLRENFQNAIYYSKVTQHDRMEYEEQIRALQQIKEGLFKTQQTTEQQERLAREEIKSLNTELKNTVENFSKDRVCCICLDAENGKFSNVVFFPCCHLVCCSECSVLVKDCPVCRVSIDARVPVYIP